MTDAKYCKDCGQILAPVEGADGRCWNCHRDYEQMLDLQSRTSADRRSGPAGEAE